MTGWTWRSMGGGTCLAGSLDWRERGTPDRRDSLRSEKVYLYKLFKKLGMNDRLDMALYGRRNLFGGQPGLERTRDTGPPGQFAGKPVVPRSLLLVARKQPGVPVVH